jgi:cytoskeletal protein RodZ
VTVGETLSHARRKRGLSLEDVAAATRIRATVIEAIEADHFELCGGTVYARGHIRSISKVIGIDSEELIGQYDADHQVERVVAAVVASPTTDQESVARSERRRPNWAGAMVAALVLICGLALAGLLANHSGGGNKPSSLAGNSPQTGKHHASSPPSSPPPTSVAELPASRATMLVRTTNAQTWLSITTKSGKTLFSGLLPAGQHKVFSDRHGLAYVIGNAPAVDIVVNGNDIGSPPSSSGVVARGSIVPGKDTVQQA